MDLLQLRSRHVDVSDRLPSIYMTPTHMDRYSTLDNVDGKQARRTGTSSGLGELFEFVPPSEYPWMNH